MKQLISELFQDVTSVRVLNNSEHASIPEQFYLSVVHCHWLAAYHRLHAGGFRSIEDFSGGFAVTSSSSDWHANKAPPSLVDALCEPMDSPLTPKHHTLYLLENPLVSMLFIFARIWVMMIV